METFPRYWPFVQGIHRSPVNSPHRGQWCGALMFSLICAWINSWVNNGQAGDLRRHCIHYDVIITVDVAVGNWTNDDSINWHKYPSPSPNGLNTPQIEISSTFIKTN